MQSTVEQKSKQLAELLMQLGGLHSPVMKSRHQEDCREFDAGRDRDHSVGS